MRLFLALDIIENEVINTKLRLLEKKLKGDSINWNKPENTHLTLKFMGNTPAHKVEKYDKIFKEEAEKTDIIKLNINRLGIFGSSYQPKVIWIGFDTNSEIVSLASRVKLRLEENGFPYDRQNFVPHITLGRVVKLRDKKYFFSVINDLDSFGDEVIEIDQMKLFNSELTKDGPVYHVLKTYNFSK